MPTVRSHDREYIEPERHDELSAGTPEPVNAQANAGQERKGRSGRIAKGANIIPAMGGKATKGRSKLTHNVPDALPVSDKLRSRARYARRRMATELARTVGGGVCGMLASAIVKLGVEDMAMREAAMAEGKRDEARKLGESARMHLMYAREVCAKDAASRPRTRVADEIQLQIDAELAKQNGGTDGPE
jgi:hypothetical protein